MTTKHIVSFSGGLGSWLAAKRVAEQHGTDDLYLVFTDVLIEDEDLYRFLPEAAANVGGQYIHLTEGRDPWDVFRDKRYMGNSRTAHCSETLKSDPFYAWVAEHGGDDCIVYLGIDWSESHRLENARKRRPGIRIEAPLCDPPYLTRTDVFKALADEGIALPRLYEMGFSHNNCGGCCVKAGQGQWAKVHELMPERYAEFEQRQEELMAAIPTTRPFLRIQKNNVKRYYSLKAFREEILEINKDAVDSFDIGGCGCFLSDTDHESDTGEAGKK